MSIVPRNIPKIDLCYRHIKGITLFQQIYRHKKEILRKLNNELEIIYDTLVSVTNNISTNYIGEVIPQENYLSYLSKADALLDKLNNYQRPLTLRDLSEDPTCHYSISYLMYQVTELVKVCGASSCYDVFNCLVGSNWDLAIKPQHNRLVNLFNTMFVPINVKLIANESSDVKVLKYSPVPPTKIGVFFLFLTSLIFLIAIFNQSPVEKLFFTL